MLACCLVLCACQPPQPEEPDSSDTPEQPLDPTLLNGFENNDDLYAVYPTDISPKDEYQVCINTDSAYVKDGEGSFKYTFINGTAHSFIQLVNHSQLPDLDVTKLKSVSLQVYNASETTQKITLSLTTTGGAAMFSKQQELQPGVWTEVKYDQLAEFSYKKKTNVGGVLFRFDVDSAATLYVDEMRVELGAEDVPPEDFNQVVTGIADIAPQTALNGENFADYVKFIDAVGYARRLYDDLQSTAGYEASYTQLQAYEDLLGGFSAVYTPRSDEDIITKWEYGNGLTIAQEVDETYGGVWSVIVDAKSSYEQSFKFTDLDVSEFGEVVMWIYNPTEFELKLQVHGGWNSWSAYATTLVPKEWTMVRFNTKIIENDTQNSFFPIISNAQKPFEGMFLFTALYGVPAAESASEVIAAIEQLPDAANVTTEHRQTVENIRTAYDELSKAAKAAVTNYQKLTAAENQLATIDAAAFDRKIAEVVAVEVTPNNVIERYSLVTDLVNEYYALSDLAFYRVDKWEELEAYKNQIETYKEQLVKDMVDAFPSVAEAEFPKIISQVKLAKTLFDELEPDIQAAVDVEKLNALVAECQKYVLGFDFTVENSDKVSMVTDFGNSWQGTTNYVTDSTYGNVMVCDVKSGHTNAPTQAEFRLRVYDKIWQYEKICFYVYAPTENTTLVVFEQSWTSKPSLSIPLAKDEWTLIEIDANYPTTDNLDGIFCIFTASSVENLVGQWKVSSVYLYFDQQKVDGIVDEFVSAMANVPEKSNVTAEDKPAIVAARALYDAMPEYCKGYVPQFTTLQKKLIAAEEAIETLEASSTIGSFTQKVNALGDDCTGQDILDLWIEYKNLGKHQSEVSAELVEKIKAQMIAKATEVAAAYESAVEDFVARCSLPRDIEECKLLYDVCAVDFPDEVFAEVSKDTTKAIANLNKVAKKYKVATTDIRPSETVVDETYGTAYVCTVTDQDGCILKLQANVVKNGNVVLYVYRPENGGDARLYAAMDNPWTTPAELQVTITQDGWTRIEFSSSNIQTSRDCYVYLVLSTPGAESESGWLVSELYYY